MDFNVSFGFTFVNKMVKVFGGVHVSVVSKFMLDTLRELVSKRTHFRSKIFGTFSEN